MPADLGAKHSGSTFSPRVNPRERSLIKTLLSPKVISNSTNKENKGCHLRRPQSLLPSAEDILGIRHDVEWSCGRKGVATSYRARTPEVPCNKTCVMA